MIAVCSRRLLIASRYYCYLLTCSVPSLPRGVVYVGYTSRSPSVRLQEHNQGRGSHKTSRHTGWRIVTQVHGFRSLLEATRVSRWVTVDVSALQGIVQDLGCLMFVATCVIASVRGDLVRECYRTSSSVTAKESLHVASGTKAVWADASPCVAPLRSFDSHSTGLMGCTCSMDETPYSVAIFNLSVEHLSTVCIKRSETASVSLRTT